MAQAPLRKCAEAGCTALVRTARCKEHKRVVNRAANEKRADPFYTASKWRKLRHVYLAQHPLCEACLQRDYNTPATEVHHIQKRTEYPELAYAWDNLEALCKPCHSRETARGR